MRAGCVLVTPFRSDGCGQEVCCGARPHRRRLYLRQTQPDRCCAYTRSVVINHDAPSKQTTDEADYLPPPPAGREGEQRVPRPRREAPGRNRPGLAMFERAGACCAPSRMPPHAASEAVGTSNLFGAEAPTKGVFHCAICRVWEDQTNDMVYLECACSSTGDPIHQDRRTESIANETAAL